jgi:beta-barrel assembly-enhancing protease
MSFNSRLPAETEYKDSSHILWDTIKIFMFVSVSLFITFTIITTTFDFTAKYIPIAWENKISQPINSGIKSMMMIHPDQDRVQKLLDELIELDSQFIFPQIKIKIIKGNQENAFAYLGGGLAITKQLLNRTASENELSFVLAHELGHHAHRHPLKSLSSVLVWQVLLATAGLSSISNGNIIDFTMNAYSRSHEEEADLYALALIHKRYGHLKGIFTFFERHQKYESWSDRWSTSHPLSTDRINKLTKYAESHDWPLTGSIKEW